MKKIRIIISIIITILSVKINSQDNPFTFLSEITSKVQTNCKLKGESDVRQFSDCDTESNYTNNQICCLIYGINADRTNYRGCVAMNLTMFANKTLEYDSETISGRLICDKNYNYDNYYKNSFIFSLFLIIFILVN